MSKSKINFTIIALIILTLQACAKKQTIVPTTVEKDTNISVDKADIYSRELDIHGKEFTSNDKLRTIYFDYDEFELYDDARMTLQRNAKYIQANPGLQFLVEGHCDQRGTSAYNLSLGQKRAAAVRKYYIDLGVTPEQIGTISFGEEKLGCQEETEECWEKNRRGETKVSNPSGK